jgi:hypothetical protein
LVTSRKDFLVAGTLAAAFPAAADAATPAPSAAGSPAPAPTTQPWPKFVFDTKAFDGVLNGPQTHKHLFTTVQLENGTVFEMVDNTLTGYTQIGVQLGDVLPAVVLYHGVAIAMGFDDHAWDTYFIPSIARMKMDPTMKAAANGLASVLKPGAKGNPFLHASGADDASIETLVRKSGMRLFMCNLATRGVSEYLAKMLGLQAQDVYADLAAHVLPTAMLAPSGVWAVHAVQQHNFTLLPVTVSSS